MTKLEQIREGISKEMNPVDIASIVGVSVGMVCKVIELEGDRKNFKNGQIVWQNFDVVIPSEDRQAIAYTVPIQVPCRWEASAKEFILTAAAIEMIEDTQKIHEKRWRHLIAPSTKP